MGRDRFEGVAGQASRTRCARGRLGEYVLEGGAPSPPRRPKLAPVFGEPALVDACFAGCEAQHRQTAFAKKKRQDVVFFVNTARSGVRGACPRP
jgi:hypothetical protein